MYLTFRTRRLLSTSQWRTITSLSFTVYWKLDVTSTPPIRYQLSKYSSETVRQSLHILSVCVPSCAAADNQRSQTALHIAAELAKIDVVEMLLKAEFDLTIQDKVRKSTISTTNVLLQWDVLMKRRCAVNSSNLSGLFFFWHGVAGEDGARYCSQSRRGHYCWYDHQSREILRLEEGETQTFYSQLNSGASQCILVAY